MACDVRASPFSPSVSASRLLPPSPTLPSGHLCCRFSVFRLFYFPQTLMRPRTQTPCSHTCTPTGLGAASHTTHGPASGLCVLCCAVLRSFFLKTEAFYSSPPSVSLCETCLSSRALSLIRSSRKMDTNTQKTHTETQTRAHNYTQENTHTHERTHV